MIKKFIDRLLGKDKTRATGAGRSAAAQRKLFGQRVEVGPEVHRIDLALVDARAVNVVATLKQAGHQAYIVGGAVRDLLLGLKPKDFDVATDATPEQVKALFRRAFIIGRRFRIVHVVHGRGREHEVIEVSTFRAYMDASAAEAVNGNERTAKRELANMKHAVDASGRVLRDNVWGPQIEDAARRDFTVNAMYYDPQTQLLVDYHGGLGDAQQRRLRMIGEPAARYHEDPVRMIRAVRFAAKLSARGFTLDPKSARPLAELRPLLAQVPQSRLFDEMLKLLQTGHAVASVQTLRALGLASGIYPLLDEVVARADEPFVRAALIDTDRRVGEDKPVAPAFLLACVLWRDVRDGWQQRLQAGAHPLPALHDAIDQVFDARIGDVSGRGRLGTDMREIWTMQPRFEKRSGKSPFSLAEQPRFRAGFDFLRLRADAGEVDETLADWWQEFSLASDSTREDMVEQLKAEQRGSKAKKPRVHRVGADGVVGAPGTDLPPAPDHDDPDADGHEGEGEGEGASATPAKKRRRRRRKPASGNGDAAATAPAPRGDD